MRCSPETHNRGSDYWCCTDGSRNETMIPMAATSGAVAAVAVPNLHKRRKNYGKSPLYVWHIYIYYIYIHIHIIFNYLSITNFYGIYG